MVNSQARERAVDQLQQLGLKQYEARCFVALIELRRGTARSVSEQVDVPRTRVYEAARMLEEQGLIEIQHSSPQQYRPIPLDEAVDVLQSRYESRIEILRDELERLEGETPLDSESTVQEVWSMGDRTGIRTRTFELIGNATEEVVLIVGDERALSEGLDDELRATSERGVTVIVGAATDEIRDSLRAQLPAIRVFGSDLEWLQATEETDEVAVGRLLLVDRTDLLASSIVHDAGEIQEHGVFGTGFGNSLVVIARRLLSTGLETGSIGVGAGD